MEGEFDEFVCWFDCGIVRLRNGRRICRALPARPDARSPTAVARVADPPAVPCSMQSWPNADRKCLDWTAPRADGDQAKRAGAQTGTQAITVGLSVDPAIRRAAAPRRPRATMWRPPRRPRTRRRSRPRPPRRAPRAQPRRGVPPFRAMPTRTTARRGAIARTRGRSSASAAGDFSGNRPRFAESSNL